MERIKIEGVTTRKKVLQEKKKEIENELKK